MSNEKRARVAAEARYAGKAQVIQGRPTGRTADFGSANEGSIPSPERVARSESVDGRQRRAIGTSTVDKGGGPAATPHASQTGGQERENAPALVNSLAARVKERRK